MIFRVVSVIIFLFSSSQVFAIFDASLVVGKKTTKFDSKNNFADIDAMGGASAVCAVHWQPISVAPIGLGVFAGVEKSKGENESYDIKLDSQVAGLDVSVWGPFRMFKPFLSFGYLLNSSAIAEIKIKESVPTIGGYTEISRDGKLNGYRTNAGVEWSVAPTFSIILQYTKTNEKLTYNEIKGETAAGVPFEISVDEVETSVSGSVIGLGFGVRI